MQIDLRHELDDREWATIETLLSGAGRPVDQARRTMDGILWVMHTGHDWHRLPDRYGPCEFVQQQFCTWAESGLLDAVLDALEEREAGAVERHPSQAKEFAA